MIIPGSDGGVESCSESLAIFRCSWILLRIASHNAPAALLHSHATQYHHRLLSTTLLLFIRIHFAKIVYKMTERESALTSSGGKYGNLSFILMICNLQDY